MSETIDSKVVEMKFDNKQFESNVQTTLSTLDKLKQSLKLTEATKGLQNISNEAKNVDMSGIASAVDTLKLDSLHCRLWALLHLPTSLIVLLMLENE